jgi:hypothetical protein
MQGDLSGISRCTVMKVNVAAQELGAGSRLGDAVGFGGVPCLGLVAV